MVFARVICLGLVLGLLPTWCASAPRPDEIPASQPDKPESNFTIAVADFEGADKELGRFLADTLLTNLAQSERLHLVERSAIRQALAELKLRSEELVEPQQVKKLGKLVSADHLVVGSFLVRDNTLTINARLLDVKTGRLASGGAASVSGNRDAILALTTKLARQFHRNVTHEDMLAESVSRPAPPVHNARVTQAAVTPDFTGDVLTALQQKGLLPGRVRPDGLVRESDLAALVKRVAPSFAAQTEPALTLSNAKQPVTRLRVLAALVKLAEEPDRITAFRADESRPRTPDNDATPTWGQPFVAAAVTEGWWNEDEPLKARNNATWAFVASLLTRMPIDGVSSAPPVPRRRADNSDDSDAFTGLVIDAGDFEVQRAMSPRILDEEGNIVYPDPKRLPDYDFLLEKGLVAYSDSLDSARRSGDHPLIVRALDLGVKSADLVVSDAMAERIREAEKHGKFFSRWAVCFLTHPH